MNFYYGYVHDWWCLERNSTSVQFSTAIHVESYSPNTNGYYCYYNNYPFNRNHFHCVCLHYKYVAYIFVYFLPIASRVCHCNGEWGQVHCRPSLQLVEELVWWQCCLINILVCLYTAWSISSWRQSHDSKSATTKLYHHHSEIGSSYESSAGTTQHNTRNNTHIYTGINGCCFKISYCIPYTV